MIKVSVIVPVFNPGSNIDRCLSSLLGQSLPPDQYEVIFVDDGSTDETPARLDEIARAHPHVRVEHTPNSGWPGRPRNIGLDLAQGEFVYFVDNDDWLDRRALERLHGTAVRNEADIVIGKVVGHGRLVTRSMFVRGRREVPLTWRPLMGLLTPHKLFRKAMLDEHRIRFAEGRRRLEDHLFVVHAYFHAKRISVLAAYPCYHWIRSPDDVNASWREFDPAAYFDNVREVLDLVDAHTEPGPLRDQMHAAWYRGKMLPRVGGSGFLRREPAYRHDLYGEIRRLVVERYDPNVVDAALPFNLRVRARLLRQDRYQALGDLAEYESQLRADVTIRRVHDEIGKLVIELEAAIGGEHEPLLVARRGQRMEWMPPAALKPELPQPALELTPEVERSRVQVVLRSRNDESEYVVPTATATVLLRAPGAPGGEQAKRPVLIARAEVERARAAAGSRLPAGEWDVHVLVEVAGFSAFARTVRRSGLLGRRARTLTLMATTDERLLTRPTLARRLARRFPALAGFVKRFRPQARRAGVPAGA